MPVVKWRTFADIGPETPYTVMASRLPLRTMRTTPRFLALTREVQTQLATADGLVGYTLNAQLTKKTFWTFSAWTDQELLNNFAASIHHGHVIATLAPHMKPTTFQTWTVNGDELPITWPTVMTRLNKGPSETTNPAVPEV